MNLLIAIVLLTIASLDVLALGMIYGLKKIHINIRSNLFIALTSGVSTVLAIILGELLDSVLSTNIFNIICGGILITTGICQMLKNVLSIKSKESETKLTNITMRHLIYTATILAINNIGLGITLSNLDINMFILAAIGTVLSFSFLVVGLALGKHILQNDRLSIYSGWIDSIMLILLGIIILL